eukprot:scaffold9455_cov163-Amphora_coffeaeformis.AAC.4
MLVLVHAPELLRILTTASSVTARCLSLAVLVLSLAPLASLYVVFVSMLGPPSFILVEQQQNGELQSSVQAAAHAVGLVDDDTRTMDWTEIANNRTALEELWKAMYEEASKNHAQHPLLNALRELSHAEFVGPTTAAAAFQQHWSIVIPWMFTFILGVVVPMILSLWSFLRQYRRGRRGPGNAKRRRKEMLKRLDGYTKPLVPQDCCIHEQNEKENDDPTTTKIATDATANAASKDMAKVDDETTAMATDKTNGKSSPSVVQVENETNSSSQWLLPLPGQKLKVAQQQQQSRRAVPGLCVVCLNPYQLAERVTWSSNPSCVHCFHTDCIAKWLTRQLECPCCRRDFLLSATKNQ